MKKLLLSALMIASLCGCSQQEVSEETEFEQWRSTVLNVQCAAIVTVSQENTVAQYEQSCEYEQGVCSVMITAPENIAGIHASRTGADTQIEYDGLLLSLGEVGAMTAINAIPTVIDGIVGAHLELCYNENDGETELICAVLGLDDENKIQVWLDAESLCPTYAELLQNGRAGIKLEFTKWDLI